MLRFQRCIHGSDSAMVVRCGPATEAHGRTTPATKRCGTAELSRATGRAACTALANCRSRFQRGKLRLQHRIPCIWQQNDSVAPTWDGRAAANHFAHDTVPHSPTAHSCWLSCREKITQSTACDRAIDRSCMSHFPPAQTGACDSDATRHRCSTVCKDMVPEW